MRLAVGDLVVYGSHGAGAIVARRTRNVSGERQVVIVLALAGGLSVELPLARADELLRTVADETEIKRVHEVLSADPVPSDVPWLKRRRDELAKLNHRGPRRNRPRRDGPPRGTSTALAVRERTFPAGANSPRQRDRPRARHRALR